MRSPHTLICVPLRLVVSQSIATLYACFDVAEKIMYFAVAPGPEVANLRQRIPRANAAMRLPSTRQVPPIVRLEATAVFATNASTRSLT
jgi:hypothetical protein